MSDGVKVTPHSDDCLVADEPRCYVLSDADFRRDKIGRRNPKAACLWHIFRCNDPRCASRLMIRWDVLSDILDDQVERARAKLTPTSERGA